MKISEIELVPDQSFSKDVVRSWISMSTPKGFIDGYCVNYIEHNNDRVIILTDKEDIVSFVGLTVRLNGKVWQVKNTETFEPYKGKLLVGKTYKFIKEVLHKSIQSDFIQTISGAKIWTETLPKLGLDPMIYDTKTANILNPKKTNINVYDDTNRYTWILSENNIHPSQNLEESILIPLIGIWYDF